MRHQNDDRIPGTEDLPPEIEPARDLWPGIEARIGNAERMPPRKGPRERRWTRPWVGGLAAAACVAALAAGSVFLSGNGAEVGEAGGMSVAQEMEEAYGPALEELRLLVESRELAPETREVIERNLLVIDGAIRETQAAVEADPGAPVALASLRRMYERKLDVLRTVAMGR